jgi:broad specificity phosphatase PhoE
MSNSIAGEPLILRTLLLWDTKLTPEGRRQADQVRLQAAQNPDNPLQEADLLVASPLTRALTTAELIFSDCLQLDNVSRIVNPLASERLYFSSEVGQHRSILQVNHPSFNFDVLEDHKNWWFSPSSESDDDTKEWRPYPETAQYACPGEPVSAFRRRMQQFKEWLAHREERRIVVVTHWGVIRALTGRNVHNCQVTAVSFDEILDDFLVDNS